MATGTVELESLIVRLLGDGSSYQRMLEKAHETTRRVTGGITGGFQKALSGSEQMSFGMGRFALQAIGALTPLLGIMSGIGGAFKGVQLAASTEMMEVAFGTMLQSAEKGKELERQLIEMGAKTPLNLKDLEAGAKMLLQFKVAGNDLIPMLTRLGDTANGNAERLMGMARAFGQMKGMGVLHGQERLQFINAGFDPLGEISRTSGKGMPQLMQMMEKGQITVKMVTDAFISATSAGGAFFQGMESASKTASGLFSTLQDDIDGFFRVIGQDIIEVFNLKEVMKDISSVFQDAGAWIKALPPELKKIAAWVIAGATALGVMTFAWPLLSKVAWDALNTLTIPLRMVIGLFHLLHLGLVAKMAAWVAWKMVMIAANAVMTILTFNMALVNTLLGAGGFGLMAWAGALTIVKVATWLWNAALTVMNVLLAPATLLVLVGTVSALAAVFVLAAAAVYAVWEAGKAAFGAIKDLATASGPIKHITGLFGEWFNILKDVFNMAKTNLPGAWLVLKYGFALAVSQIRDLWPPLWAFIQAGFSVTWDVTAAKFKESFFAAMAHITKGLEDLQNNWTDPTGLIRAGLSEVRTGYKVLEGDARRAGKTATEALAGVGKDFGVVESEATKNARAMLEGIQGMLADSAAKEKAKQAAIDLGSETGKAYTGAVKKELQKVDAVLFGSAEAMSRYIAFTEKLNEQLHGVSAGKTATTGGGEVKRFDATISGGAESKSREEKNTDLLKDIRDNGREQLKKAGVQIQAVGV